MQMRLASSGVRFSNVSPLPSRPQSPFRFAQAQLRKLIRAGTAGAGLIANFVKRGWPSVDYEIRRKSSPGGQGL